MSNNSEKSIKYQQENFSFANGTGQAKNLQMCYDAGYLQRQQEDLEKHRWIPVEEDKPPIDESLRKSDLHYSITQIRGLNQPKNLEKSSTVLVPSSLGRIVE